MSTNGGARKCARWLSAAIIILGMVFMAHVVFAAELAYNGGFESGTSGWSQKYPSFATFTTTSSPVHSGSAAASLDKTNGAAGRVHFGQIIGVNAGQDYTLSGWAYGEPIHWNNVHLRIEWLDASGSTISTVNASPDANSAAWTSQTTGSVTAPLGAVTAQIEGYGYIMTGQGHTDPFPIYFDDISFQTSGPTGVTLSDISAVQTSPARSSIFMYVTAAGLVTALACSIHIIRRR